jgi:hypothetical protein
MCHTRVVRHGDRVRLVREVDSLQAGALGRIFGYMHRTDSEAFVVAFDAGPSRILEESDLELVDKPPVRAPE